MLRLKLQYFGHQIWTVNSLEKILMLGKIEGERKREREDEMVEWHPWLKVHESEQTLGDSKGQRSLVCCSSLGRKESDTTWRLNNNNNNIYMFSLQVVSDSSRPHGLQPSRLLCSWDFPGKNTWVSCLFLLQGIFPTQGWKPHLFCLLCWQAHSLLCHCWCLHRCSGVKGEKKKSSESFSSSVGVLYKVLTLSYLTVLDFEIYDRSQV